MNTLYRCGRIGFHYSVRDGTGARIARDFLQRVIKQLCIQATTYHSKDGSDHFLRFNERLMYSQMAVAINSLTKLHVSEESLTRNHSGDSTAGRADFWAYHRHADILLELKQCYFSVMTGASSKRVSERMKSVINQTHSLKTTAKGWGSKAALIGLCVALPYCQRNSERRLDKLIAKPKMDSLALGKQFVDAICQEDINFVGLWLPPGKMQKFSQSDSGKSKWEYNPFVGFAAKIVSL